MDNRLGKRIMKHFLPWVVIVFVLFSLAACGGGRQSALEGILVDWNGKPVAGVKITASQVQLIKGYEQLEAVTGSDGRFRIRGLFPSSAYILKPWSDKWDSETVVRIESAPQGETAVLPEPMVIAQVFTKHTPVAVADIATGAVAHTIVSGKLVDWNNNFVDGVKITAVLDEGPPVAGYRRFETMTGSDGSFRFPELLAASRYVLMPVSDMWDTETSVYVSTPEYHGENVVLPRPMVIAQVFTKHTPVAVADIATGAVAHTIVSGKLVDWNNNFVDGVKITAVLDEGPPVEGYRKFETVTGSDGSFRFPSLLASSRYILKPVSDKWNTNTSVSVNTPKYHGEDHVLPGPMVIGRAYSKSGGSLLIDLSTGKTRFTVSSDGVIKDNVTGLEWVVGPDRDINLKQAEQWVATCKVSGGGWRMPTHAELENLYLHGASERNIDPVFKITGWLVWAAAERRATACESRDYFNFSRTSSWAGWPTRTQRVFGVRSSTVRNASGSQQQNQNKEVSLENSTLYEDSGWKAKIVIGRMEEGSVSGNITYRSLNCTGELVLKIRSGQWFIFDQIITQGRCVNDCELHLKSDGTMYKEFCRGRLSGTGYLHK